MPTSYHDHNADDWHDRDFARFRRNEARRFPVVSEREISEQPKSTMKFTPTSDNVHFNEWYKEFHLLFEDSHGNREETMEIAQACYDAAQKKASRPPLATPPLHHLDTPEEATFEKDLTRLINCYSKENGSDTPDFILAQYMAGCLDNFNTALQAREKWYGREIHQKTPCDGETTPLPDSQ